MIALDIEIEAEAWREIAGVENLCRRAADAALAGEDGTDWTATLLLADDATLRDLNAAWRGQDKATNVLSFPSPEMPSGAGPRHLGDVAIAFETTAREAEHEGKRLADHLAHLVVHGMLHLAGHDHEVEAEALAMEALEVAILARLGIADPYRVPA